MVTEFIYLSILYLNKKRGFPVVTCLSTFVPILYHIKIILSNDFNTYFKIILYFLLLIKDRGFPPHIIYFLLIKDRGFPYDAYYLYLLTHKGEGK